MEKQYRDESLRLGLNLSEGSVLLVVVAINSGG